MKSLKSLLLILFLMIGMGAWAETTYKLQQVSTVAAGEKYVFVQDTHAMGSTVSNSALQTVTGFKTTGLTGTEAYVWTLETATGGFYMKNVSLSTNAYLNNASKTSVSFGTTSSVWTFDFTDQDAVLIQNKSNSDRFLGYTTATSYVYKAYATSNLNDYPHAIKVYKLVEETNGGDSNKTLTSLTVSGTPTKTVYFEDEGFDPAGLTVTGTYSNDSQETISSGIDWTVTPSTLTAGTTSVSVVASVGNVHSASYTVNGLTVNAIPEKTIAEFIAAEGGKCYLTGTVSNIKNTTYGNFDLTDESGTIYVYGCLTPEHLTGQFSTLGVVAGDKIKVLANEYELYNETEEAKNVIFVEEIEVEKPKFAVTIVDPENGTLTVKEGENVLTSGDEVEEGKVLTIECTPADGYRYQNWQYKEAGNWITMTSTMTRTVTQAISIRANFEAIPTYTVAWSVNGAIVKTEDLLEGATVTAPDVDDVNGKVFRGWAATENVDAENPEFVTPMTTATAAATYYAVFATQNGEGDDTWVTTPLASLTEDDVFVMACNTKAISTANGTSGNPAAVSLTVSAGKITSEVSNDIKWNVTGNATDGYTFYKNGTTNYLYVNTTATSGSNTCIRVGTQNSNIRNNWKPDTNGYLKTNDSYTARYLSFYATGSDFRGYVNTSNGAFAPTFYKFVPGITYSDYTTKVLPAHGELHLTAEDAEGYWTTFSSTENVIFDASDVVVYTVATDDNKLVLMDADCNSLSCVTDKTKDDGWVSGYYVQAGVGVLINAIDDDVNYYFIDTDPYTANDLNEVETDPEYNMLVASSVAQTSDDYLYYMLSYDKNHENLGFYWGAENGGEFNSNLVVGKAYLQVPKSAGAKPMMLLGGGTATGIENASASSAQTQVYNLQGQRVNAGQKGIVIVNGRKVVVK